MQRFSEKFDKMHRMEEEPVDQAPVEKTLLVKTEVHTYKIPAAQVKSEK